MNEMRMMSAAVVAAALGSGLVMCPGAGSGPPNNFKGGVPAGPVRPKGLHIGRNGPCPCGSGKKFKKCCRKA